MGVCVSSSPRIYSKCTSSFLTRYFRFIGRVHVTDLFDDEKSGKTVFGRSPPISDAHSDMNGEIFNEYRTAAALYVRDGYRSNRRAFAVRSALHVQSLENATTL